MLVGSGNWTVCNIHYVHCNRTVAPEWVPFFTLGSSERFTYIVLAFPVMGLINVLHVGTGNRMLCVQFTL